jgi:hypothetical protein
MHLFEKLCGDEPQISGLLAFSCLSSHGEVPMATVSSIRLWICAVVAAERGTAD